MLKYKVITPQGKEFLILCERMFYQTEAGAWSFCKRAGDENSNEVIVFAAPAECIVYLEDVGAVTWQA